MTDESKARIHNLPEPEQELTAEQTEEAQGGFLATPEHLSDRRTPAATPGALDLNDLF